MRPPKWADKFLQWYCRPDKLEEIQGDLHELFRRKSARSKRIAQWQFVWNVIRFFKLKNVRNVKPVNSFYTTMFKSYLLTGMRNAISNRLTTLINVLGLSLGVGVAVTVFIFMDFMWHMDSFHSNKERIYEVVSMVNENNKLVPWGDSPLMLGPFLSSEHPEVESTARVEFGGAAVRYNDVVFSESIWFVDPTFQQIFSFPVIKGDQLALKNKNSIVLTGPIAQKYFGAVEPVGQTLSLKFSDGSKQEFIVGAVLRLPENSGMRFGILLSMEKFYDLGLKDTQSWRDLVDATFVMLKPGHDIAELKSGMDKYSALYNSNTTSQRGGVESFDFVSLPELSSKSNVISSEISYGADPKGVWSMGIIALLLLLLACFNYMNVAVATVSTRLKEIGIRKVIGSGRKQIVQQFLTENVLMCTFSLVTGAMLSYLLFLPGINSLYPFEIPFMLSSGNTVLLFFFGLLTFIGLVSGTYPALYVSRFTPIAILRGREKFGQRGLFSRILLTSQFVLAFTTIVGSFVFIDNATFQRNRDWGYNHDRNIVVPVKNKTQYLALRDKVSSNQNIESVAGSADAVGHQNRPINIDDLQKKKFQAVEYLAGYDYLETMNMRLKEGRFFKKEIETDNRESVIINESFAKHMNWRQPLKQSFEYDSVKYYVVGVVYDFHYSGFYNITLPVIFRVAPENNFRFLSLRTGPNKQAEVESFLKGAWKEVAPDDPYEGFFQDSVLEIFYRDNDANIKLLYFFSTMAVLLACLGLFGLVSYNITRRIKEFSIRKVFGANVLQIFKLMNRDYIMILGVAFLIGAPAGFYFVNTLIQHLYPEPQAPNPLPFLVAISLMAATVAITVGSQLRRVITENPTSTLRSE